MIFDLGVRGWYPLLPPATPHKAPISGPTHQEAWQEPPVVRCAYVGGVEVAATVSTKRDQQLVLSSAERAGWEPSTLPDMGGARKWQVELQVKSLWMEVDNHPRSATNKQPVYCFVRYRFFDLGEEVT